MTADRLITPDAPDEERLSYARRPSLILPDRKRLVAI